MSEPIRIPCEGSRQPCHLISDDVGMCSMCGVWVSCTLGRAHPHDRNDILAMLDRGDFG